VERRGKIIIQADARHIPLPDGSVNCIITSPPYWSLRKYDIPDLVWDGAEGCEHRWGDQIIRKQSGGIGKTNVGNFSDDRIHYESKTQFCLLCNAWRGQLGLEPTIDLYLNHLLQIMDECKRVLRDDGTMWVNLGDSYYGGKGQSSMAWCMENEDRDTLQKSHTNIGGRGETRPLDLPQGTIQPKSLCLIPERFAIEMVERDTMDIYELDKKWIVCNNLNVTEDTYYALQRPDQGKGIQHGVSAKMESGTSRTISKTNEGMGREEPRQNSSLQQEALLVESGRRNNEGDERECKSTPKIKNASNDELWWESSQVRLLWGNDLSISNDRSHQWENTGTQEGTKKVWIGLSVAKEDELSRRFQGFVYELQLGNRKVWILPPSRGKNLRLRKRDIPLELLPLFKLHKPERWILRSKIIWHKPNCMPSSAKDRFTVDFEPIFFFVKSRKYWFEQQYDPTIEPYSEKRAIRPQTSYMKAIHSSGKPAGNFTYNKLQPQGRNRRCVWTIPTQPYSEAHFATFPEALVEPMIRAGCPKEICVKCGKAREKIIKPKFTSHESKTDSKYEKGTGANRISLLRQAARERGEEYHQELEFLGYTDCGCNAGWRTGIVLDPFCGSGTVIKVAEKFQRKGIGIDLGYQNLQVKRISNNQKIMFA